VKATGRCSRGSGRAQRRRQLRELATEVTLDGPYVLRTTRPSSQLITQAVVRVSAAENGRTRLPH
jgi:hypothetical protein